MATTITEASLSDGLAALIKFIEPTRKTGLVVTRADVGTLLDGLHAMHDEARHLETIVDRVQWNEKARREAVEGGIADGTITIFPVAPRATAIVRPGGGEGGAA
jgi:hypothetical protein